MPEYLAPGVYVEEVSSGNKPIQAASTSTAGMVGLTVRGPVNKPTLVTSLGQANRIFGGKIDHNTLSSATLENLDALPYAIEGFFNNGGARLYVTRIVGSGAARSSASVYATDMNGATTYSLAASTAVTTGDLVFNVSSDASGELVAGVVLQFTEGTEGQSGYKNEIVEVESVSKNGFALNRALVSDLVVADGDSVEVITIAAALQTTGAWTTGGTTVLDDTSLEDSSEAAYDLQGGETLLIYDADPTKHEVVVLSPTETDSSFAITSNSGALQFDHDEQTPVYVIDDSSPTSLAVAVDAASGDSDVLISDAITQAEELIRVGSEYYIVSGYTSNVTLVSSSAFANSYTTAATITLISPAIFDVHAIYQGAWGDEVRVRTEAANMLTTKVASSVAGTEKVVELDSVYGLQAGSYIEIEVDSSTSIVRKVASVDRTTGNVTLTAVLGSTLTVPADPEELTVKSLEFNLIVERLENGKVVESELFENLALDSAHSNYAPTVVGTYTAASDTISSSGDSELIRLSGFNTGVLPLYKTDFELAGGSDGIASVNAASFKGTASQDPDLRTGIQAMINESDISIVAVPGRTEVEIQKSLITHCENMRYRFAVLDSESDSKVDEAKKHRQNYDTTHAAYYYPWLTIADPFGVKGDELSIPPSGHMLGVYARTDIQRGVHKAPANEVVKSILSFETKLTKGEQDVLNPIHVNCFRDFRAENRGLRIYGARTLSSDPEWRYVNVRRLFLFLEKSVDDSMQWAVFEPNAEPLWATVKRSLVNFLLTVWRSGALEGTSQDEAFFVNVGRDTMSQADIDNGRLIVEIGVAPVKPAEFVIFRFSQKTREA